MTSERVTGRSDDAVAIFEEKAAQLQADQLFAVPSMAPRHPATITRCPRCRGRMFPGGSDGDTACFTCGHVIYSAQPSTLALLDRHPTHGGQSL
jgi:tRNA(Ile2) C34 agmatinyltransferase TiaS